MITMKDDVVATIPCNILSKELSANLKLSDQPYIILIPKSLLQKFGIYSENLSFNLIIKNKTVSLLGNASKKVKQLPAKEVVT